MMNDEHLRQKLDGILALTMTTAGLAPQGFDQILALIHEERVASAEKACRIALEIANGGEYGEQFAEEWAISGIEDRVIARLFPPTHD